MASVDTAGRVCIGKTLQNGSEHIPGGSAHLASDVRGREGGAHCGEHHLELDAGEATLGETSEGRDKPRNDPQDAAFNTGLR